MPETALHEISIPAGLAAEVQAAAAAEHRPVADLVRDALVGYLANSRWPIGYPDSSGGGEEGTPTEAWRVATRDRIAQGVRSLEEGRGMDGENYFDALEAGLDALERQRGA